MYCILYTKYKYNCNITQVLGQTIIYKKNIRIVKNYSISDHNVQDRIEVKLFLGGIDFTHSSQKQRKLQDCI